MTPPASVAPQPRSACVEPVDVRACVEATLRDEGLGALWDSGWADAVVTCESRWTPTAVSPYGHLGLWQVDGRYFNGVWASLPGPWYDPEANTRAAAWIYRLQGPRAWSCSP